MKKQDIFSLTSESDESDTSPQNLSDYDLDILNHVQNPDNLNATPHQTSSLLSSMSGTNPVSATTISSNIKKKLKTPTPFSGKREDLHKFLQEIKIYLLANGDAYPNDSFCPLLHERWGCKFLERGIFRYSRTEGSPE